MIKILLGSYNMVSKIILVLLCGVLGISVGIYIKKRLDRKVCYFSDVSNFCEYFKNDLNFRQTKLKVLISSFQYASEDFKNDIANFIDNFNEKKTISEFLLPNEKNEMNKLFNSLGKVDIKTQIILLEDTKTQIEKILEKYKLKSEKDGKLFIKLGFLFGITLGVLLL